MQPSVVFKKTDNQEQVRKMSNFRRTFARKTNKGFIAHLKSFKPDVVLCTHYLPLEILCHPEDRKSCDPFTVCVVADCNVVCAFADSARPIAIVSVDIARTVLRCEEFWDFLDLDLVIWDFAAK